MALGWCQWTCATCQPTLPVGSGHPLCPGALITLIFGLIYLWLYTRHYDWTHVRTPIAFTGVSVLWLLLYSKGWSPQFLVWILAFLALLTPTLRGVALAIAFTFINFVESHVFLVILPDERWIMVVTVLARTILMLVLAVEWLGQIWPAGLGARRLRQIGGLGHSSRGAGSHPAGDVPGYAASGPGLHRPPVGRASLSRRSGAAASASRWPNADHRHARNSSSGVISTRGCVMNTRFESWMPTTPTTGPPRSPPRQDGSFGDGLANFGG